MTPEEAYEEALRRIRVAEETGALELNLSELKIDRLPPSPCIPEKPSSAIAAVALVKRRFL